MSNKDEEYRRANKEAAEQYKKMRGDMDRENDRLSNEGIRNYIEKIEKEER